MKRHVFTFLFTSIFVSLFAQTNGEINNLILPDNYPTNGKCIINKYGTGTNHILIIADIGFSDLAFAPLIYINTNKYTFHVVTLPGSNLTPVYSLPKKGTSYSEKIWLNNVIKELNQYIDGLEISNLAVLGHINISSWVAMQMAINNDTVSKLIMMAGVPFSTWPSRKYKGKPVKFEERKGSIDYFMAPRFYKTITRDNWEKGLYAANLYSNNHELSKVFWHQSASVPIAIMVQYLCEFFTDDISTRYNQLKKPVLVLEPDFKGENLNTETIFWKVWDKARDLENFKIVRVENSSIMMAFDQNEKISLQISNFMDKK